MSKPRLLDLFCGAGGAGMGYHLAGFDVVGVDIVPQPHYLFEFHQADALQFLSQHGSEYDVIHASPPCQEYSNSRHLRNFTARRFGKAPDVKEKLIEQTRAALVATGKPWIMENVEHAPMPAAIVLCGTMFSLPLLRHRAFEASFLFFAPNHCNHPSGFYSAVGGKIRGHGDYDSGRTYLDQYGRVRHREGYPGKALGVIAMGIDWMTVNEMCQAIPPAYTEYIGGLLLANTALLSNTACTREGVGSRQFDLFSTSSPSAKSDDIRGPLR